MTATELRALRTAAGLTQKRAAEVLGYSLGHYASMERGRHPIHARLASSVLARLEKAETFPELS